MSFPAQKVVRESSVCDVTHLSPRYEQCKKSLISGGEIRLRI